MTEQDVARDDEFEIKNELEFLIRAGRDGNVSLATIFQALLRSTVYMVLNKELKEGDPLGSVQSLMVQDEQGSETLTVFTREECCEHFVGKQPGYDFPTAFPALMLLDNMRDDMGLVVNPGLPVGIQITAEGVRGLKQEYGQPWLKNIPAQESAQGGDA